MNTREDWAAVVEQLARCEEARLIDRFVIHDDVVVLRQGRYAHHIPVPDLPRFLHGMLQYASAAGVSPLRQAA